MLREVVGICSGPNTLRKCLLFLGAINCAPAHRFLQTACALIAQLIAPVDAVVRVRLMEPGEMAVGVDPLSWRKLRERYDFWSLNLLSCASRQHSLVASVSLRYGPPRVL
jgi:hypothetical protein